MKVSVSNDTEAAFMEELKAAIADRNATLDEVIALVRSRAGKIYVTTDQEDFAKHLIRAIEALKS